jgi:hypothetical protein
VPLQKREQLNTEWQAKFFVPAPDMELLPDEESPESVPLWAWNSKYSEAKQQPAAADAQEWQGSVCGQGFVPWQFRANPLERKQGSSSSKASSRNSSRSPTRSPKKDEKASSPSKSKS